MKFDLLNEEINNKIQEVRSDELHYIIYKVVDKNKEGVLVKIDFRDQGIITDALILLESKNKKGIVFDNSSAENNYDMVFKEDTMRFVLVSYDNKLNYSDYTNYKKFIQSKLLELKKTIYKSDVVEFKKDYMNESLFEGIDEFKLTTDHEFGFEFLVLKTYKYFETIAHKFNINLDDHPNVYEKYYNVMKKNFNKSIKAAIVKQGIEEVLKTLVGGWVSKLGTVAKAVSGIKNIFELKEIQIVLKVILQRIYSKYKKSIFLYYKQQEFKFILKKHVWFEENNILGNFIIDVRTSDKNNILKSETFYGIVYYPVTLMVGSEHNQGYFHFIKDENLQRDVDNLFDNIINVYDKGHDNYTNMSIDNYKNIEQKVYDTNLESENVVKRTILYFKNNSIFRKYFEDIDITGDIIETKKIFEERFKSKEMVLQLENMPVVKKYSAKEAKELHPDEDPTLKSKDRSQYHYVYDNICLEVEYNANTGKGSNCDPDLFCKGEIPGNCKLRTEKWSTEIGYYYKVFDTNKDLEPEEFYEKVSEEQNVERFNNDIHESVNKLHKDLYKDFKKSNKKLGLREYQFKLCEYIIDFINDNIITIENIILNSDIKEFGRDKFLEYIFAVMNSFDKDTMHRYNKISSEMLEHSLDFESILNYDEIKDFLKHVYFVKNLYDFKYDDINEIVGTIPTKFVNNKKLVKDIESTNSVGKKTQSIKELLSIMGYKVDPDPNIPLSLDIYKEVYNDFNIPLTLLLKEFLSNKEINRLKKSLGKEVNKNNISNVSIPLDLEDKNRNKVLETYKKYYPKYFNYIDDIQNNKGNSKNLLVEYLNKLFENKDIDKDILYLHNIIIMEEIYKVVGNVTLYIKDNKFFVNKRKDSDSIDFKELLIRLTDEYNNEMVDIVNSIESDRVEDMYPDKSDYNYKLLDDLYNYILIIYKDYIHIDRNTNVIVYIDNEENINTKYFDVSETEYKLSKLIEIHNEIKVGKARYDQFVEDNLLNYYLQIGKFSDSQTTGISLNSGKILVNLLIILLYMSIFLEVYKKEIQLDNYDISSLNDYIHYYLKTYVVTRKYVKSGKFDIKKVDEIFNIKKDDITNLLNTTNSQSANIIYSSELLDRIKFFETKNYPVSNEKDEEKSE